MQGRKKIPKEISAEILANAEHNRQLPVFAQDHQTKTNIVYPRFDINMLGLFAQTCQHAEADTAFLRLMTAAVEAEPMSYKQEDETSLAACAILKRHPELLFVKGTVTDHFGRKIFASPYQLFLGAGDVWALKQMHEEIIPNIKNGGAKAQEQFQQQFPNCKLRFDASMGEEALYDDRNIAQIEQVKESLKKIVAAITADPCTSGLATRPETADAIAELCQLFTPKEGEVIRTGLHFPLAIMQEIFKVYNAQFGPWSGTRVSFFSREVIGAALDASTAVDGQCYKYGLSKLDDEKGPDRRDGLFCRRPGSIPLELSPLRGKLGRTMFVDPYDGESCFQTSNPGVYDYYNKNGVARGGRRGWAVAPGAGRAILEQLMARKNLSLTEFMRARREEKTSWCVIL